MTCGRQAGLPDTLGSPPSPGEDVPRPPPLWEEGARGGEDESSHVVRQGKQEVGAEHSPEGAREACGEPPACPPDRADSVLSLTARDVADHSSVCFSDVSCSFFFFFLPRTYQHLELFSHLSRSVL